MTDIVVRLRRGWKHLHTDDIVEAANEIERLQRLVKLLEADNKRLRAILCDLQGSPHAEHDNWGHDD